MRIVQVVNYAGYDRGGAERLACDLHDDLRSNGMSASIVSLEAGWSDPDHSAWALDASSPYSPASPVRLARYCRHILADADVVHAHLFPATLHVAILKAIGAIRAPCIMTEHNTTNRRRGRFLGRALDRFVYDRFDRVAAISQGVADALTQHLPDMKARVDVVRNGARLSFQHMPECRPRSVAPVIISVGRLVHQKNYETALDALSRLSDIPFRYVVLGDGPDREALVSRAKRLGICDRVEFRGHVDDVDAALAGADIFLIPSRWEGFGLAAVEAMNVGLPVIASDVPGLREVVGTDGKCARLVAPEDPGGVADAIASLLASREVRHQMGCNGFERSLQFDRSAMTKRYMELYAEVQLGKVPAVA